MISRRRLVWALPLAVLGVGALPAAAQAEPVPSRTFQQLMSSLTILGLVADWNTSFIVEALRQAGLDLPTGPLLTVEDRDNFVMEFSEWLAHKPEGGLDAGWWYEVMFRRGIVQWPAPDPNKVWADRRKDE